MHVSVYMYIYACMYVRPSEVAVAEAATAATESRRRIALRLFLLPRLALWVQLQLCPASLFVITYYTYK